MKYVNSRMENGEIKILYRDLITKVRKYEQEHSGEEE